MPVSELGVFQNISDELNDVIVGLTTLEAYVVVHIHADADGFERLSVEEIMAAVNDQLNPELDENENMLETSANTKSEPIPSDKKAIQLVMDDAGATEEALCLTIILEQNVMRQKVLKAKKATITKYFRPNDT